MNVLPPQLALSSEAQLLGIIRAIESGRVSAGYVASIGKIISRSLNKDGPT